MEEDLGRVTIRATPDVEAHGSLYTVRTALLYHSEVQF